MPRRIYPFKIGEKYLIRTVSYFTVGQVERIEGDFLVMSQASWVADTGRFAQCIKDGVFSESEYTGECIVNILSVVDAFAWRHDLPAKTT